MARYVLHNSLGFLLSTANRSLINRLNREFLAAGMDVTAEHWAVLNELWRADGLSQQVIADRMGKNKVSVTKIIDAMEKRALVKRVDDEEDRRRKRIYLTPSGREMQDALSPLVSHVTEDAQTGLSDSELATLKTLLRQLVRNLEP
ncbi:MAG: MarR family transcriptional regulator [Calditrichaeota bacterium]|nr:MarR family transcriptional regulator [Calditrichota bacterium]HQU74839.1 MarR family transcriptional regulator [Calditrichia bacterium]